MEGCSAKGNQESFSKEAQSEHTVSCDSTTCNQNYGSMLTAYQFIKVETLCAYLPTKAFIANIAQPSKITSTTVGVQTSRHV